MSLRDPQMNCVKIFYKVA